MFLVGWTYIQFNCWLLLPCYRGSCTPFDASASSLASPLLAGSM